MYGAYACVSATIGKQDSSTFIFIQRSTRTRRPIVFMPVQSFMRDETNESMG